jgi:uncharacterized protein (TIGR00369 family)
MTAPEDPLAGEAGLAVAENRERQDAAISKLFVANPFVRELGLRLDGRTTTEVVVRMPFKLELCNSAGTHHGGAVSALADTAAALAIWNTQDFTKGRQMVTLAMSLQYLGAAPGNDLVATARCTKRGREVAFVAVHIADSDGAPIAESLVTYRVTL